jgi:phosphatidylserine synthase
VSGFVSKKVAALLVYGRPPLVFGGMLCAIGVMWTRSPSLYILGLVMLLVAMSFDLIDGWFAARFISSYQLAQLADRIMDKIVYSIIFPLVAVGMMWRLIFASSPPAQAELLHAVFVLLLCITVLIRDSFAHFIRGFALRTGVEPEQREFTRLRTVVAAPVGVLLYAYAFHVPLDPDRSFYLWLTALAGLQLRNLLVIEIIFMIINFGSIAALCRKYGNYCLDELCFENEWLRRKILSFFPNALTVMNAMMGLLAVFFAYQDRIREACLLLMGAALFDKLDGAVARRLGLTDLPPAAGPVRRVTMGGVLDDVADAVSFCLAPAWIFILVFGRLPETGIGYPAVQAAAGFYLLMGVIRLVYFTLDRNPIPGFFKGLPTPAAALAVTAPLVVVQQAAGGIYDLQSTAWFSYALMAAIAVLMNIYPIHYIHFGRFMSRHPWFSRINALVVLSSLFTPFFGHVVFVYMVIYLFSPLWTWRVDPRVASRETRVAKGSR